jgi:XK-related protein
MGLEFLPICDVLFNVVSLASYFCDVVFDIIATYTFHTTGHVVWFCLSLISICLSLLACQVGPLRSVSESFDN